MANALNSKMPARLHVALKLSCYDLCHHEIILRAPDGHAAAPGVTRYEGSNGAVAHSYTLQAR